MMMMMMTAMLRVVAEAVADWQQPYDSGGDDLAL